MLAEKAKIANTLMSEIMAEMPDDLLWEYQAALRTGAAACHNIYADLRCFDKNDEPELISKPPAT